MKYSFVDNKTERNDYYELTDEDVVFKADDTISFLEFLNGDENGAEEEF